MHIEAFRCRACGAELFLTYRDAAEHLIGCEQAAPEMRRLAQEWLDAGTPVMMSKGWGGKRRPSPVKPAAGQEGV